MPRLVQAGSTSPSQLRAYFQVVNPDGITPALGEAGGQPQVSVNGSPWADAGIGVLAAIGDGRYYANLDPSVVANAGDEVETRYAGTSTAECPGDSFQVVGFDPVAGTLGSASARPAVEAELLSRCGPLMATSGMDGVTDDGTNADLVGPIGWGLRQMGYPPAHLGLVSDADLAPVQSWQWDWLLDGAELQLLRVILRRLRRKVDVEIGINRFDLADMPNGVAKDIEAKDAEYVERYGAGTIAPVVAHMHGHRRGPHLPGLPFYPW